MSQINVDSIANTNEDGPVYFPYGMRGDASNLIYEPKVLYWDPVPLSTGISTSTNITVTFDQEIQFAGVGTIYIREGSATGTVIENFTCGIDPGASIAGETLVINPTNNLGLGTSYYVTLPAAGIANTFGAYYKGTESYFFQTTNNIFSADGGDYVFTVASAPSPTGYHKYHIFTTTGILTTYSPSDNSLDLTTVLVAGGGAGGFAPQGGGGGGAGGLLKYTGPTLGLAGGTYTVTIGAGGAGRIPGPSSGSDSSISTPLSPVITSLGGGRGGGPNNGSPGGSGGGSLNSISGEGAGVTGQGNPGSNVPADIVNNWPGAAVGGAGGGAGGSGGNASLLPWPGSPPTATRSAVGGSGGAGLANPEFIGPVVAPRVPSLIPAGTTIGPTGRYAGGGGAGASPLPGPAPGDGTGGQGGSGGGGQGGPIVPTISPFPSPDPNSQDGYTNTGGGGGGGSAFPSAASGGSGIFMIRYAVPAP